MDEFKYELKIPKERVAVLIGQKGVTKRIVERETSTKLDIDSEEGDVVVSGSDALKLFVAREVVTAIGRGFNPDIALKLLKVDYVFELINQHTRLNLFNNSRYRISRDLQAAFYDLIPPFRIVAAKGGVESHSDLGAVALPAMPPQGMFIP